MAAVISMPVECVEESIAYACPHCDNQIWVQSSVIAQYENTAKICPQCERGVMDSGSPVVERPWQRGR